MSNLHFSGAPFPLHEIFKCPVRLHEAALVAASGIIVRCGGS